MNQFLNFRFFQVLVILLQIICLDLQSSENTTTAIDSNGSVVVVWQENTSMGADIKSTSRSYSSMLWEPEVVLSTTPVASKPVLGSLANGSDTMSVAIWVEVIGGTAHLFGAMRPSLLSGWTSASLISNGIEDIVGNYQLAINPLGKVIVTWSSETGGVLTSRSSESTINLANSWIIPLSF